MNSRLSLAVAAALGAAVSLAAAPPRQADPPRRAATGAHAAGDVIKAVRRTGGPLPPGAARAGEVVVTFQQDADGSPAEKALRDGRVGEVRRGRSGRRLLVTLSPDLTVAQAIAAFSRLPGVRSVEPNGLLRKSQGTTFKPNDPYYADYQWNFTMVNAERTWGIQKGQSKVAVAVLDTGIAYEDYFDPVTKQSFHKAPDWGDTEFLPGHDFVNDDDHPNDDEGHGTHVASTIAEATNNDLGLAGLAFGCAILPVKILDETGTGSVFAVAEGIDYAADYSSGGVNPVKVINLSLGSEDASDTIQAAINRAYDKGITVVAAAGNSGKGVVEFPARGQHVLAIGALDPLKNRASYSNTGVDLELMAPGGTCETTVTNSIGDCVFQQTLDQDAVAQGRFDTFCYCGLDGTSMATPHVSAVAALLYSQGFSDVSSVRQVLEQTAERLGGAPAGGRNDTYGYGLVRPAKALSGMGLGTGPQE
ncbi:MAG TPA: S8 family serine peptidase [Vicinamibacteria bacterium]|nr:S8 family serine peptidase [Vicinamibacteria bacterium]